MSKNIGKSINVILTTKCNQSCPFCFYRETPLEELNLKYVRSSLHDLKKSGYNSVILTGGEPSVFHNLPDLIEFIVTTGFGRCSIHTNGNLIEHNNILEIIKNNKNTFSLTVSLHGSNASKHDGIVGKKGSYKKAERMIRWAAEHEINVSTNTAISNRNLTDIVGIVRTSRALGAGLSTLLIVHDDSTKKEFATDLSIAIKEIVSMSNNDLKNVRTEGIPFCLIRGFEELVGEIYWPRNMSVLSVSGRIFDYRRELLHDLRYKSKKCRDCIMDEICVGVYKEYKDQFESIFPGPIAASSQQGSG